jgi:23S rRNA (guanosine2251-2'-O)-methyltransferase
MKNSKNAHRHKHSSHAPSRHAAGPSRKPSYKAPHKGHKAQEERRPPEKPRGDGIFLWGLHAVRAAWLNPARQCLRLWTTEAGQAALAPVIAEGKKAGLERPQVRSVDRQELDRMTPPGSVHQGIVVEVALLQEPELYKVIDADPPPDLLLVLDQVTDPHNVGAILRSAAAFGAGAVIMTERNAPGTTGVLAKSASGALEHVPQIHVVNLARAIDDLREAGYWCVGLAEEGERDMGALDLSGRTAVILGNEGEGLRHLTRKKCDELARLPTGGAIGSLNVSNAAAVALYEVRRQKGKFAGGN